MSDYGQERNREKDRQHESVMNTLDRKDKIIADLQMKVERLQDKRLISLDEDITQARTTVASAAVKIKRLQAEIERLKKLLSVALCPDDRCDNGNVPIAQDPDGQWDWAQCQWCAERSKLKQ